MKTDAPEQTLRNLAQAVATSPGPVPLVCAYRTCGGDVVLGGVPAPTYTCTACGAKTNTLCDLRPVRSRP